MALLHHGSVLRALGEPERSQAAITEARAVIGSCPDPGILTGRLKVPGPSPRPGTRPADEELTRRERRAAAADQRPVRRDIGQQLYVSHNTVHRHVRSIYRKLGVSSRAHALQRTRELRLL
jgi:DNA-binding NarL/FixJ family response regulator